MSDPADSGQRPLGGPSSSKTDKSSKQPVEHANEKKRLSVCPAEYELIKRLPPRQFSTAENDVYVTRRTQLPAQLKRSQKLFEQKNYSEINIHGLGVAINRAINLGLKLKAAGLGSLELSVNTGTVELTDDLLPLLDELEPRSRVRNVSVVHIKVFKVVP